MFLFKLAACYSDVIIMWKSISEQPCIIVDLMYVVSECACFVGYLERCRRAEDEVCGYHAWQPPHLPTFSLKGNSTELLQINDVCICW